MALISKPDLARSFSHAAPYYHHQAQVQRYGAQKLVALLRNQGPIPSGTILEVGCGTGFLSEGLREYWGDRPLLCTDLSPGMVAFCEQHLREKDTGSAPLGFQVLDGETLHPGDRAVSAFQGDDPYQGYGLITSSFALQWFQDPITTLGHWLRVLHPRGWLALAFPSALSFPEWRQTCETQDLPLTLNPLPPWKAIVQTCHDWGMACHFQSEWFTETYDTVALALKHLKALGASETDRSCRLSPTQLKTLMAHWPTQGGRITVSYHLVFVVVERQGRDPVGLRLGES